MALEATVTASTTFPTTARGRLCLQASAIVVQRSEHAQQAVAG